MSGTEFIVFDKEFPNKSGAPGVEEEVRVAYAITQMLVDDGKLPADRFVLMKRTDGGDWQEVAE